MCFEETMGKEKPFDIANVSTKISHSPLPTQSSGMPNLFKETYVVQPAHCIEDI